MKAVLQRVSRASVTVDGETTGSIDRGVLVLLGVGRNDTVSEAEALAGKISRLRIFPDDEGVPNVSLLDAGGSALVVSQFTVMGNARKGNRPSFTDAAWPEPAEELYDQVVLLLADILGSDRVATGRFGANMQVELVNDGPYTIILDTTPADS